MEQRLLMIAYYFPPLGGAGVQRSAKFAKYLARSGWRVEVVAAAPSLFEPLDPSLEQDVLSERITIRRVGYHPPLRSLDRFPGGWRVRAAWEEWLVFPDRMRGWLKPAAAAAAEICDAYPGIPVYTTSAPYTAHLVGLNLKQRYGTPWIADFRDEWSQNPYGKPPTRYHRRRHQAAEKMVLTGADAVVSVTDAITDGLRAMAPEAAAVFATIPNGFDPEDLNDVTKKAKGDFFTIAHVGTLNQERLRLLQPLFDALAAFIAAGKMPRVRLKLVGSGNPETQRLRNYPWLEALDCLPHHQALETMAASDLAILAEANPAAFTGKIFEYLGLHLPVLGLVHPDSPAAALIRAAAAGWVAGPHHDGDLADILLHCYHRWEQGAELVRLRGDVVQRYNRECQARDLAALIQRIPYCPN